MTIVESLKRCPLFRGLSEEQLQVFACLCNQVTVGAGSVVFREGGPARFLYMVDRGRVVVEMAAQRPDGSPTHPMTVAALGPGEAFGWSAIIEPHVMTLSARAVEQSDLVLMEAAALREVLRRYRDVGYVVMSNLAGLLAQRLAQTREALIYERGWAMVG